MLKQIFLAALFVSVSATLDAAPSRDWKAKVAEAMPLMGHRNWILVVDSAYPLQTSSGVDTVETNADQIEVTQAVLSIIGSSIHVRPIVFMDSELPYVPEADAPGASAYREKISKILGGYKVQSLLHEGMLATIDQTGKAYQVLVLKTNMTVPYSSVFIRLDCKYWSADAEERLRTKMKKVEP